MTSDQATVVAEKLAREHRLAPWFAGATAISHAGAPAILLEVHFLEHHLAKRYDKGWGGFPVLVRRVAEPAVEPKPWPRRRARHAS